MKIQTIHLRNFRRFSDLTITDIPTTTRLVVLVGPNGSGKSSVFDGLNVLATIAGAVYSPLTEYYGKAGMSHSTGHWAIVESNQVSVTFHDASPFDWRNPTTADVTKFYIRTGYRYQADFVISTLNRQGDIKKDPNQPRHLMSLDGRVASNYERLVAQTIADVFVPSPSDSLTKAQFREQIIGRIRDAFNRVLSTAVFTGLGDPLSNGSFFFEKGISKNWPFKNLSAGEKAVFDLVLDLTIKSDAFNNTVYCIDEPEVHVNSNIHSTLLQELYNSMPGDSQLWIATHSAGMMRKAREIEEATPGTVVFLDFAESDFDQTVILRPAITDRKFWQRNFTTAVGELAELIAPKQIFFCEGDPNGRKKKGFDARCYTAIFTAEFPDTVFLSVGSSSEVQDKTVLLGGVFSQFLPAVRTSFIIDRDDYTDLQRAEILTEGNIMLELRHLEVYLLDDEILKKLCDNQGKPEIWPAVYAEKQQLLAASTQRGNPSDDWKSIGESLRLTVKRSLNINQLGNNADAFMLSYLVPLVTRETIIYQKLKQEIFS